MTKKQAQTEKIRIQRLINKLYDLSDTKSDYFYFKLLGMVEVLGAIERGSTTIWTENVERHIWRNNK